MKTVLTRSPTKKQFFEFVGRQGGRKSVLSGIEPFVLRQGSGVSVIDATATIRLPATRDAKQKEASRPIVTSGSVWACRQKF